MSEFEIECGESVKNLFPLCGEHDLLEFDV